MSQKASAWLSDAKARCKNPRCRYGVAVVPGRDAQDGCQKATAEARSELAKAIKVRVQSVFEDKLQELNGTVFQEVRSKIVVSTDVELKGAPQPECIFDEGQGYALATMDFGPKIDFLRRELERRKGNIDKSLQVSEQAAFDDAFVGYARAFVEAINADDQRVWLVGLDPQAAGIYANIPNRAIEAMDGLMRRARKLSLASVSGQYTWAQSDSSLEVRLLSGDKQAPKMVRDPVIEWSGPLVRSLGYGEQTSPPIAPDGRVKLPLKTINEAQTEGETRAVVALNWPKTLVAIKSRVGGNRSKEILDWIVAGLPTVQAELTVYGPGHPSALVDSLRELICNGDSDPLTMRLELKNASGRKLSGVYQRRFKERLDWALSKVRCRETALETERRKKADKLEVKVWAPSLSKEVAQVSFNDRKRRRRSVVKVKSLEDVCILRCEFEQWEAAERTCGKIKEPRGAAGVCQVQARYYSSKHEEGLKLAEQLYRLDKKRPEYAAWYGILLAQTGKFEEGTKVMESVAEEKALSVLPDFWLAIAVSRCRAGDEPGAKRAFKSYLKIPGVPKKADVKKTLRTLSCGT